MGAGGEGFHNFHHTFPNDYSTSEYGAKYFNPSKAFIDIMAFFGQAYDRRQVSAEVILQRRARTGDLATCSSLHHHDEDHEHDY